MSASLNRLQEKVGLAVATIASLRKEKERLEAEVSMMQDESRRARKLLREHQQLLSERGKLKTRLERLMKKLETLKV